MHAKQVVGTFVYELFFYSGQYFVNFCQIIMVPSLYCQITVSRKLFNAIGWFEVLFNILTLVMYVERFVTSYFFLAIIDMFVVDDLGYNSFRL